MIKKYPNRRLYNTKSSTYIVLDDVVELVKKNVEFVIEDAKTGEDITRSILNQIIFEQETTVSNFHFPLEFQKQLIAMYGDTYGSIVPDYLTESMNLFIKERLKYTSVEEDMFTRNAQAMMEFSQNLARHNMELFKQSWSFFGYGDPDSSRQTNKPDSADTATQETELEDIQNQIDALQKRLKSLK